MRFELEVQKHVQSARILAESCLRDANGAKIALETVSNLLEVEELPLLPSVWGCSGALRWSRFLSLWWPDGLLEDAMADWPCAGGGARANGAHGGE